MDSEWYGNQESSFALFLGLRKTADQWTCIRICVAARFDQVQLGGRQKNHGQALDVATMLVDDGYVPTQESLPGQGRSEVLYVVFVVRRLRRITRYRFVVDVSQTCS
jgi:hypothetical protein